MHKELKLKRKELRLKLEDPQYRLYVYESMLERILLREKLHFITGFCLIFPEEFEVFCVHTFCRLMPELIEFKPKKNYKSTWWFSPNDFETRIDILIKIIDNLKSNINQ